MWHNKPTINKIVRLDQRISPSPALCAIYRLFVVIPASAHGRVGNQFGAPLPASKKVHSEPMFVVVH
jgi:hypothetical protein